MRIYNSYPVYAPGKGAPGYLDWLQQQEPSIVFDSSKLRGGEDWRTAGEIVFDAPIGYDGDPVLEIVSSAMLRDSDWYRRAGVPATREGVMPFARSVVRRKGVVEVDNLAGGMCHTRVMPDGSVIKGAQGNFPFDRTLAFRARVERKTNTAKDQAIAAAADRLIWRFLFSTPWARPDTLASLDRLSPQDLEAIADAIPPGVLARHGTSVFSPVQVADLIGVRDQRYLDRTGQVRHRGIGDMMRYAALNQGADDHNDYGRFVPLKVLLPDLSDPTKQSTRYGDEQLYALASIAIPRSRQGIPTGQIR